MGLHKPATVDAVNPCFGGQIQLLKLPDRPNPDFFDFSKDRRVLELAPDTRIGFLAVEPSNRMYLIGFRT